MVYAFRIHSPALSNGTPASDMDGHTWTFQDQTLKSATARAHRRLDSTFCYATRLRVEATSLRFIGEYVDRRTYERAQDEQADTMPAPSLTMSDADAVVATLLADDLAAVGT